MNIILVEDDRQQAGGLVKTLKEHLAGVDVRHIETASQFMESVPLMEENPPVFIILDLMLAWQFIDDKKESPQPEDYDIYRGGVYLKNFLQTNNILRDIPVLLWTASQHHAEYNEPKPGDESLIVAKKSLITATDLANHIRSLLIAKGVVLTERESIVKAIAESIEVKPSFFGISLDVKAFTSDMLHTRGWGIRGCQGTGRGGCRSIPTRVGNSGMER